MNEEYFWKIIEESKVTPLDSKKGRLTKLKAILSGLTTAEVVAFHKFFQQVYRNAYSWDLWSAAQILYGGCSDDSFTDFRYGLIASGREKYLEALQNPDSLADWVELETIDFELFGYVAVKIYQERTGETEWPKVDVERRKISGKKWAENGEDLPQRFPKMWAKFGS